MNYFIDIAELISSINLINAKLITANHLLREPGIIDDDIYKSLKSEFIASRINEAIDSLDNIYWDFYRVNYKGKEAVNE